MAEPGVQPRRDEERRGHRYIRQVGAAVPGIVAGNHISPVQVRVFPVTDRRQ